MYSCPFCRSGKLASQDRLILIGYGIRVGEDVDLFCKLAVKFNRILVLLELLHVVHDDLGLAVTVFARGGYAAVDWT